MKKSGAGRARGQAGFEFLAVTGIGILLIIGVTFFLLGQSRGQQDEATIQQAQAVASTLVQQAETVWSLGRNSWVTVDVNLPQAVTNLYTTENDTIVTEINTQYGGLIAQPTFSSIPIRGGYGETNGRGALFNGTPYAGQMAIKVFNNGTAILLTVVQ